MSTCEHEIKTLDATDMRIYSQYSYNARDSADVKPFNICLVAVERIKVVQACLGGILAIYYWNQKSFATQYPFNIVDTRRLQDVCNI